MSTNAFRRNNVFAQLGIGEPDVELAKAELASRIQRLATRRRMTIDNASSLLQVSAAELSDLFRGRLATCSIAQLLEMLTHLGDDVEILIRPRLHRTLRGTLRVVMAEASAPAVDRRPVGSATSLSRDEGAIDYRQLLDKHEVERVTSLDIATIYRKMSVGEFPQPVRVGRRRVAWRTSDIMRWEEQLEVGTEAAEWMLRRSRMASPTEMAGNASVSVQALYLDYQKHAQHLRSWTEQRRIFEKEVVPVWGDRAVADIKRRDVRHLVSEKAKTAPVMANRLLARISRLFSFAVEEDWIQTNPASGVARPTREQSRDRVLSRAELRELWTALQQTHARIRQKIPARLSRALSDVFLVMLLTGQRCGEVCRMQWRDVDLSTGWWLIRAEDAKNSDAHRVPLTALALEIITRRRGSAGAGDQYVFSNHAGSCVADRAKKAASELCRGLSFQFRAHDIRRTVASYMGEAGLDRFHIALVLNHRSVTHNSVTAIYDRYRYEREKRLALETWSDVLQSIVKPEQPGSIRRSE